MKKCSELSVVTKPDFKHVKNIYYNSLSKHYNNTAEKKSHCKFSDSCVLPTYKCQTCVYAVYRNEISGVVYRNDMHEISGAWNLVHGTDGTLNQIIFTMQEITGLYLL